MSYRYIPVKSRRRYTKNEYRSLFWTVGIFVAVVATLFFVGIPLIGKAGELLSKLAQGNTPLVTKKDTLAPRAPYIESLPEGTKEKIIQVKGLAEPGSVAILNLNDENIKEILVDGQGNFIFEYVPLKEGTNKISATAKDSAGNVSERSTEITIIYKNAPPKLEVSQPIENQIFKDINNPIKVAGTTDLGAKVYVNDTSAIVDTNGSFEKYLVLRDEGKNIIKLKAVDIAGNETTKEITVLFQKK